MMMRCIRLLLLLLLLLIVRPLTTHGQTSNGSFVPPSSLKIAYLGPLNLPNANTVQFGQPGLFIFNLAIQRVNNASAAWRANQSLPVPLLPYTTIEPIWVDTKSDQGVSVRAAYNVINAGAIGIVGEWLSGLTQAVQYVAAGYQIPQVSPGATALEFATQHASQFPTFMRVVPNVSLQAKHMLDLVSSYFGWKKIGVIFASDPFGTGGSTSTANYAPSVGVTVVVAASFNIGDKDMSYQIQRIVSSEARIIAYWGLIGDFVTLIRQIKSGADAGLWPNILGDGYQWLPCHAICGASTYTNSTGGIIADVHSLLSGIICLNYYDDPTTPEYQEYFEAQSSAAPWSVTPIVVPGAVVAPLAVPCWDATNQLLQGIDWMLSKGLDPTLLENRPTYYQAVRNRTSVGATGPIRLDENGDILAGFGVYNFQRLPGKFVVMGFVNSTGTYKAISTTQFEYLGSDSSKYLKPSDTPIRPIISIRSSTQIGLIVVCSILIFMCIVLQITIVHLRNHNLIKGSSPVFLFLYTLGIQMLCASVIPRSLESEISLSPIPCQADLWLTNLGYTLLVGALFVKTYRLQAIFNMTKLHTSTKLGDEMLLGILTICMLFESALLLGLQYGAPISMQLSSYDTADDYYSCMAGSDSNKVNSVYLPVTIAARFTLLIATAVMAYRVRDIPDTFNESKQLLVTVYNLLFLSVLLPAIDGTMGRGKDASVIAYAVCVFFICVLSVLILFVPKFMTIHQGITSNHGHTINSGMDSPKSGSGTTTLTIPNHTNLTRKSSTGASPSIQLSSPATRSVHGGRAGGSMTGSGGATVATAAQSPQPGRPLPASNNPSIKPIPINRSAIGDDDITLTIKTNSTSPSGLGPDSNPASPSGTRRRPLAFHLTPELMEKFVLFLDAQHIPIPQTMLLNDTTITVPRPVAATNTSSSTSVQFPTSDVSIPSTDPASLDGEIQ